jgi:hypothetical protein
MGKTSWGSAREHDAIEEIADTQPKHVSADDGRYSLSGRGGENGGKYNQPGAHHGEVYGLDGEAVRGMRKKDDEEWREYLLSVYDVEQRKVLSQIAVGCKENEITKAPKALECVEISQKVVTADAMHTQKHFQPRSSGKAGTISFQSKKTRRVCTKTSNNSFRQNIPRLDLGRSRRIFKPSRKSTKDMGALKNVS